MYTTIVEDFGSQLFTKTGIAQSLFLIPVVYGLRKLFLLIHSELTSPLRDLPGPSSSSFIYGNFKEFLDTDFSEIYEGWIEDYGSTIKYTGIVGIKHLYTTDLKAINHILVNSHDYQKPSAVAYNIGRILGDSVLLVERDVHKRQRKILNPAFGPQQIRQLTPVFIEKAIQLRDIWAAEIQKQDTTGNGEVRLDALSWLSRATLDVIGQAGFNYDFHALSEDPEMNELNKAFSMLFKASTKVNLIAILRGLFPILRFLPASRDRDAKKAKITMDRIGNELLAESKKNIDNKAWDERNVLSILMRANMTPGIPPNQRLSDQEVLAQIPTFLVAGHETTSVAITWALYALTQNKEVQTKLREEVSSVSTDTPTMDDLNALPYLENVVRETLRLFAPVPASLREATKDDILPLSKPFKDRKGRLRHEIRIKKGQTIVIPITPINRSKDLWGEDAREFKPERWNNLPEAASSIPGVWGNLMTFIGGPRACIGYRFSLVEMKALLFTLIRAFEFELAVPAGDITRKTGDIQRPILTTDSENSNQLPVLVRPVSVK